MHTFLMNRILKLKAFWVCLASLLSQLYECKEYRLRGGRGNVGQKV